MREAVRGIIIDNDSIILIHRIKDNREYYVFPGGGLENESLENCLYREIDEELGIKIDVIKELYIEKNERYNHFFLCKYISGSIYNGNGPEYNDSEYKSHGTYEPVRIKIEHLKDYNIVPKELIDLFLNDYNKDKTFINVNKKVIGDINE